MRPCSALAAIAATLLLAPSPARADMGKAIVDGERYGAIVPDQVTAVRVDAESLTFALSEGLATAEVTASYRLTNGGASTEHAGVAFVFMRGEGAGDDPGPRVTILADGAPVEVRAVSDADLLEPRLRAWLEAHAAVDHALHGQDGAEPLPRAVADAGGHCSSTMGGDPPSPPAQPAACPGLVAWYRAGADVDQERLSESEEDAAVVRAAREAIPDAAGEIARGWSLIPERRLGFLLFDLDFQPAESHAVTVRYVHRAGVDRNAFVNETYAFAYLLSPAKRWAGFGALDVSIRVPGRALFSSPLPFRRDGDTYRAALTGLGGGDLTFSVTSLDGMWLGMTRPGGYWAILVAAMAATAIAMGYAAGRVWAGVTAWGRWLVPLVTAGPLSVVCSLAVLVVMVFAFPRQALGFGTGALVGGARLLLLAGLVGALASALTAARRRAARRSEALTDAR